MILRYVPNSYVKGYAHDDSIISRFHQAEPQPFENLPSVKAALTSREIDFAIVGPEIHAYGGYSGALFNNI